MKSRKIEEKDIKNIFQTANKFLIGTDDVVQPTTDEECAHAFDLAEKCFVNWFNDNFKVESIERYDEDEVNKKLVDEVSEKLKKLIEDIDETLKKQKEREEEEAKNEINGKMINSFLSRLTDLLRK